METVSSIKGVEAMRSFFSISLCAMLGATAESYIEGS